jgi:formiminotetrahydrofolate cyclodeaminase
MTTRRVVAGAQVDEWLDALATESNEPGAGAFSALAAASGAALVAMVARRTGKRKAFADVHDRMQEIASEADAARTTLLAIADREAEAFTAIMDAYRMPRGTEADAVARLHVLQEALEAAVDVQLDLARRSVYLMGLAEEATAAGDPNAAADGMGSAAALHAAAIAALANVEINAFAIPVEERRAELMETCASLQARADLLLDGVRTVFRGRIASAAGG